MTTWSLTLSVNVWAAASAMATFLSPKLTLTFLLKLAIWPFPRSMPKSCMSMVTVELAAQKASGR
ncbi:hypothetical protein D3C86_2245140 [compost metagenome]